VEEGAWAFVPRSLPPSIRIDAGLLRTTEEAARELGQLAGLGGSLTNPHLLIHPFLNREAVLSSKIEGSQATLSDVLLLEVDPARNDRNAREVSQYVEALELGLARSKKRPVGLNLLLEMHELLMTGAGPSPGQFRTVQNWIGPPGSRIGEASYVPPPPPQMREALNDLERFVHAESDLPLLVRLALIHYQFEAIHPFIDGNGRVGRLLIALLLCTEGALPHPLLYLSEFFERYRREYYQLLLEISRNGNWNEWIRFFLTGVARQSRDSSARVIRLQRLRSKLHAHFQSARSSALLLKLIDELFRSPYLTYRRARSILGLTPRGAGLNLDKLVAAGVLTQVRGRSRPAIFVARQILHAIADRAEQLELPV
jgi:Fic family protein